MIACRKRVTTVQGGYKPLEMQLLLKRWENLIMNYRSLTLGETGEQVEISTGFPRAILCDHAQSGCEICSQASVGETEKFRPAGSQNLLVTFKFKPGFLRLLAIPENENTFERAPFSE
ncbi:hypothetical protein TNCV_592461 [Trichonephila clavipes]|nr:hypothetical protein TNCV_592461 [Trichonephila clavipes]